MAPFSVSTPGMTFRQFAAPLRTFSNDNPLKHSDGESVFVNGLPLGNGQITGAWTPTDASGASLTFTTVGGSYSKIGNVVFAYFFLTYPSTGSASAAMIGGLPFSVPATSYAQGPASCFTTGGPASAIIAPIQNTQTAAFKLDSGTNVSNANLSTITVTCNLIYPAS
jgi:hypothetical protein